MLAGRAVDSVARFGMCGDCFECMSGRVCGVLVSGVRFEVHRWYEAVAGVAYFDRHDGGFGYGVHVSCRFTESLQLCFVSVDMCCPDLLESKDSRHARLTPMPKCPRAGFGRTVSNDVVFECDVTHCVLPECGRCSVVECCSCVGE